TLYEAWTGSRDHDVVDRDDAAVLDRRHAAPAGPRLHRIRGGAIRSISEQDDLGIRCDEVLEGDRVAGVARDRLRAGEDEHLAVDGVRRRREDPAGDVDLVEQARL